MKFSKSIFRKINVGKRGLIAMLILATQVSMANAAQMNDIQFDQIDSLKKQIFLLAQSYEGQGDPDKSKQKTLEVLVRKLLALNPMPPVKDRIPLIAGTWKQVWGPYDYRSDKGGVDPKLGVKEIYQVVFADGYYYNVAPYYPNGDKSREQISLLRGEFKLDKADENTLKVKFTKYPGVDRRPSNMDIWELAEIAEAGRLENEITIVPTWIVKLFFGGGKLDEIYTDHDMRLVYGSSNQRGPRRSLYVMMRVN